MGFCMVFKTLRVNISQLGKPNPRLLRFVSIHYATRKSPPHTWYYFETALGSLFPQPLFIAQDNGCQIVGLTSGLQPLITGLQKSKTGQDTIRELLTKNL